MGWQYGERVEAHVHAAADEVNALRARVEELEAENERLRDAVRVFRSWMRHGEPLGDVVNAIVRTLAAVESSTPDNEGSAT